MGQSLCNIIVSMSGGNPEIACKSAEKGWEEYQGDIVKIIGLVLSTITDIILSPLRFICHNITSYLIEQGFPDDWSIPFGIIGKLFRAVNNVFCYALDYPYIAGLSILLFIGIYFIAGPPIPILTSWIQWILD